MDHYSHKMCDVCGDNPWTCEVDDEFSLNPTKMCEGCADNHHNEIMSGTLEKC